MLGVLAGLVGTWQANEAIKLVLGIGESLAGRLLLVDAFGARVREFGFDVDPRCALHGAHATIDDVRENVDGAPERAAVPEIDAADLDAFLAAHPGAVLLDVREPHEAVLGAPPGALSMPASLLEARMHELDSARTYVVACRVGVNSRWAARRLTEAGLRRLHHLRGGLLAYALLDGSFDAF
ncbi:MAG: hypothetical protein NVS4B5_21450 [Vulcanimicrobiaceae bacterium]